MSRFRHTAMTAALLAFFASAGALLAPPVQAAPDALAKFGSCEGLRTYLTAHPGALRAYGGFRGAALEAALPAAGGADAGGPGASPSSPTNVQEEGVDEPDTVKASESTVFAIDERGTLRAVDAGADEPGLLGELRVPGPGRAAFGSSELLLSGDRLIVITASHGAIPLASDLAFAPPEARTRLTEVDVSDPTVMEIVATATVEGSYVSARLTGATARVVTSSAPPVPVAERGRGRALVPWMRFREPGAGDVKRRKLVRCSEVGRPRRFAGAGMLTVQTIDMRRGLPAVDVDAVMTDGEVVYASATSLYVATERWRRGLRGRRGRGSNVSTAIHRFDISDPQATSYAGSGSVEGYMLSQWSLSEHEGILRVASTTSPPWGGGGRRAESESFLTTLATDDDRLREVGVLGGLGRGERIYAVRFIGETGYVVTFREVDPLYVVDLSDPARPTTLGELKVPGYSAYLHPVAEGLLLGIGQRATRRGRTTGVQASLFDVTDPGQPVLIDRERLGRSSYSEVEYDHHAFGFYPGHDLAVLQLEHDRSGFAGVAGLRIETTPGTSAISPVGEVSHGRSWRARISRSLVVGDRLLTVSERGIGFHDPATLAQLAFVGF